MTMRKRAAMVAVIGLVLIACVAYVATMVRRGFSARDNPSSLEAAIANAMRSLAIPASAKSSANPFQVNPEVLAEAREHFASHCASCHANDGSGQTQIGQNLYPKAPDMRERATQSKTDGELYYIIHNGIRLTGMPAWGEAGKADDDSWKLALFIHHLPQLTPQEVREMEGFNPKSAAELERQKAEEEFLRGEEDEDSHSNHGEETR
ncbi:MAG: c-type cytochrome [Deltaproteobacteria bacterium]|nr:c-type cytochrome [Deltaproteobacteria bacterium]